MAAQLRKVTFPSGKRQQGTRVSLEDGEEWKQSGVRHVRVVHREQDDERHACGSKKENGVYVVDMMVAPPGREQKGKPLCGRRCM